MDEKGFSRLPTAVPPSYRTYEGCLNVNDKRIGIFFDIIDKNFIKLPLIRLKEAISDVKGFPVHLGFNDSLCYFDEESRILDRYNVPGSILGCLYQAESVLNRLFEGNAIEDIPPEFLIYWQGLPTLSNIRNSDRNEGRLFIQQKDNFARGILTIDSNDLLKHLKLLGENDKDEELITPIPSLFYTTDKKPNIWEKTWPPQTWGHFIEWVKKFDLSLFHCIEEYLQQTSFIKTGDFAIIVDTPVGQFGVKIKIVINTRFRLQYSKSQAFSSFENAFSSLTRYHSDIDTYNWKKKYENRILLDYLNEGEGRDLPILRLTSYPIDYHFMHQRNQPKMKTLEDKKIILIGCGTIGGYLASFLAKCGAGTGNKGSLILLDKEVLSSANLGRHILGMKHIGKYKSIALREYLINDFTHLKIQAIKKDFTNFHSEWDCKVDLIIDATGEEGLSVFLNHLIVERRLHKLQAPPILYSWIKGPGLATQSLLDDGNGACFQCLRLKQKNGLYEDMMPITNNNDYEALVTDKCNSVFTPFTVSVSAQAASLGLEMAIDWNQNTIKNRFRTIRIDLENTIAVQDCNPEKRDNCEECARTKQTQHLKQE